MNAEQKRLMFRNGLLVSGSKFIDVVISETGQDKWTVMSITPRGDYETNPAANPFGSVYFPFREGLEYAKTEINTYAAANNWNLIVSSAENAAAQIETLDVGTTDTPVAGSITSSGVTLSWNNTNDTKNTGIDIYRKLTSEPDSAYTLESTEAANATSVIYVGLSSNTQYTYKVAPKNQYGVSAGKTVTFTTLP